MVSLIFFLSWIKPRLVELIRNRIVNNIVTYHTKIKVNDCQEHPSNPTISQWTTTHVHFNFKISKSMIILFILFLSMTLSTIRHTTESRQYYEYNNNIRYLCRTKCKWTKTKESPLYGKNIGNQI